MSLEDHVIRAAISAAIVALPTSAAADGIGFKTDYLLKRCKAKDGICADYVAGVVDTYLTLMADHMINKVFSVCPGPRPRARRSRFSSTTSKLIRTAWTRRRASP